MSNYVNRMLTERLNFEQFAAVCTPAMAVEHTYREVSASHDQEIETGLARIEKLLFLTDEQVQELKAARLTELEARQRKVWKQVVRVDAMREQVERWEPGENVNVQGLKRFMLEELGRGPNDRLLIIHQEGIDALKAMTPREYLEELYQNERRALISHGEAKETETARAAEWRAWRDALTTAGITVAEP